jgi:hypothetical protein
VGHCGGPPVSKETEGTLKCGRACWGSRPSLTEPSLRKKTQKLRGADGPKRARLLAERHKETEKKESKLQYMDMEGSGESNSKAIAMKVLVIPEVTLPFSEDEYFFEVTPVALPFPYNGRIYDFDTGGRWNRRVGCHSAPRIHRKPRPHRKPSPRHKPRAPARRG